MQTPFSVKNLIIYRMSRAVDFAKIDELAAHFKFTPCGPQDMAKTGWVSPLGDEFENLTHQASGIVLLCVKSEKKNIPASVINERLDAKVAKLEKEQGRKLKRTEKASLKDEILHELLPVTLPKTTRTYIWVDTQAGLIIVDAASARRAEDVTALLRKTLGSLPVVPLTMAEPVEVTVTEWVRSGLLPAGLALGSDITLKAILEEGGTVTARNQDLICDEISNHIEAGKLVVKVALDWQERISFVLKDDATLGRIRFCDALTEQNDDIDREDFAQRFDADFLLYTGELMALINTLITGLGGEAKNDEEQTENASDENRNVGGKLSPAEQLLYSSDPADKDAIQRKKALGLTTTQAIDEILHEREVDA